ncbi:MAG: hypothetical protein QOD72_3785 [Acidimicrobiaceae bacterium]|jgi:acetyl-CoA acetyltransferase|nr:hypothetical protein [Acidimicrobiaceae bacterium]
MTFQTMSPVSLYRTTEGLGIWEHRGKVAAVGIGHSPTMRRWDGKADTSVGAWSILALRKAIEDAGVDPSEVDGLVMTPDTTTGARWPVGVPAPQEVVNAFKQTDDPFDGILNISPEWILKNMPELTNIKFVMTPGICMSMALTAAIQAVGDGHTSTCLVLRGWLNLDGRYYAGGPNGEPLVAGPGRFGTSQAGPACFDTAQQFQRYMHKYGKTHDMMAPFIVNSKKNGLLFPEGYFAQSRPADVTAEDYINARWVSEPANLLDNDMPIHTATAYLVTTAERAKDMKQKPAYVLGHAGAGVVKGNTYSRVRAHGVIENLEEIEDNAAATGRKIFEASGITAKDLSFENMYDGFALFHVFHIEGIGYAGIKRGEALDLFQTDISINGPNPVSPSGGNVGSGRTRCWMQTDSIQQIQGRAGARQIKKPAAIGISGGFIAAWSNFIVWSATPS